MMLDIPHIHHSHDAHTASSPLWVEGIKRYQGSRYHRNDACHQEIWCKDQARCMVIDPHHPVAEDAPVILLIPSLINKSYILDLTEELSLARYLKQMGYHVYLMDWGEPEDRDADIDAAAYVTDYLMPLSEQLYAQHQQSMTVMGYCIGGILSLALAQLNDAVVDQLILLATPWDFSKHQQTSHEPLGGLWGDMQALCTESWCRSAPLVPGAYLSWLFYLADPERSAAKYGYFATLHEDSEEYQHFMAVEHWVNDAVPLTRAFARDCLIDWARYNHTSEGLWNVAGTMIDPSVIDCPVLIVAPRRDPIVPSASALALASHLPHAEVISPDTGHIGMVIGRNRHRELWQPLVAWMQIDRQSHYH